ncbi:uncharacterized [Tachysurus ichikawai]
MGLFAESQLACVPSSIPKPNALSLFPAVFELRSERSILAHTALVDQNATAVFHVALFTLNLQFALHILQPRPRRHAGLRDKSHSPKKKGREKKMERGAKSLTLHSNAIIAAFDAGGRLCRPFVVWASSPLGRPVVLLRT